MKPTIAIHRSQFTRLAIPGLILYRCYGLDGTLMYIGQTTNLRNRIDGHQERWWFAVEHIAIQHYTDRAKLAYAERRAIWMENPYFNQQRYNGFAPPFRGVTWNRPRQIEYLAQFKP
jgi:hypothetical protein